MYLNKNIIWKRKNEGSLLYNVKTGSSLRLNGTSTQIFFGHFVNKFSSESIAASIKQKAKDTTYEEVLGDVNKFLEDMEKTEFVTQNEEDMSYINLLSPKQTVDNILLEVTKRCNLNCIHCMEGGSDDTGEMTQKEIEQIIDQIRMLGVYRLVLTGGEPFMRKDMVEIIRKANNSFIKTVVFTNGLLITEEMLQEMQGMNVLLRFSLDGATAEIHNKIRGEGTFEKTIEVMKKCVEYGIETAIASTINALNFHQIMDIVKLAEALKVTELEISEINMFGNAREHQYLKLSREQLAQLREYNLKLAHSCKSFRRGMGFERQYEQALLQEKRQHACNAGISMCYIDVQGDVYPCTLFKGMKEFKAENIKEEFLYNIWNESEVFQKMRTLDVADISSCAGCECFELCPGGCRAKAYMATNDILGPSDAETCSISKEYREKIVSGKLNYIWNAEQSAAAAIS